MVSKPWCVWQSSANSRRHGYQFAKMDGITATRLIKREYPQVAVVGLSVETKDYLVHSMLRVGASEVVHKGNAAGTLYGAIQKAVAAIQPVLIMEETPVDRQALEESSEPMSRACRSTAGQPREEP
jgi:two-component system, NarL family, response regulator NreC